MGHTTEYIGMGLISGAFTKMFNQANVKYFYCLGKGYNKALLSSHYDYKLKQWTIKSKEKVIAVIQLDDKQAKAAEKDIADKVAKILTNESVI
jgi:hypothetical protein